MWAEFDPEPFVFGVIPARGGSKGLPGKNLRPLGKIPLIGWSIRAARESRRLSRTLVSTEDPQIAEEASRLGGEVSFLRPVELSRDDSSILAVLQHAVGWLERTEGKRPDLVVLLQPTSPLRTAEDIDETIRIVLETGADSAQTVTEDRTHPWHRFSLDKDGDRLVPILTDAEKYSQRQEAPVLYRPTGSVFVTRYRTLMEEGRIRGRDHRGLIRGFESSIDIDDLWDLRIAEMILREGSPETSQMANGPKSPRHVPLPKPAGLPSIREVP